jgi:uncharacterized membrane protein YhaH (DUF805 family)
MALYIGVLKKYFVLKGRSGRLEFWTFFFCNLAIGVGFGIISRFPGLWILISVVSGLFSLAIIIPSFTVGVRRLHDTNRSGFWVLLAFIPLIGVIILIIWAIQKGSRGGNKYGPKPRA